MSAAEARAGLAQDGYRNGAVNSDSDYDELVRKLRRQRGVRPDAAMIAALAARHATEHTRELRADVEAGNDSQDMGEAIEEAGEVGGVDRAWDVYRRAYADGLASRVKSGLEQESAHRVGGASGSVRVRRAGRCLPVYPAGHQLGMVVPKGGSMCVRCRWFTPRMASCMNARWVDTAKACGGGGGDMRLPAPADAYCCDLFQTKARTLR